MGLPGRGTPRPALAAAFLVERVLLAYRRAGHAVRVGLTDPGSEWAGRSTQGVAHKSSSTGERSPGRRGPAGGWRFPRATSRGWSNWRGAAALPPVAQPGVDASRLPAAGPHPRLRVRGADIMNRPQGMQTCQHPVESGQVRVGPERVPGRAATRDPGPVGSVQPGSERGRPRIREPGRL